jgi:hypothetical protein
MPITPNTRFVGIEQELVDLVEKKSRLINEKTATYSLSEITASFRVTATAVLLQTNWTLVSGVYEQDIANTNILSTSYVVVIPSNADVAIVQAAEILPENQSSNGIVTIYSKNLPSADINVSLNIFI